MDPELLLRNEKMDTEDRILRNQIQDRLQLNDSNRISLAEIAKRLGRLRILERHSLLSAPERKQKTPWRDFIRSHTEVLAAVDFFTAEVWTAAGLITYYAARFHAECNRQGKENVILSPELEDRLGESTGSIQTRTRLDGL